MRRGWKWEVGHKKDLVSNTGALCIDLLRRYDFEVGIQSGIVGGCNYCICRWWCMAVAVVFGPQSSPEVGSSK